MSESEKCGEKRPLFDMMEPGVDSKKPCPCHAEKRLWYRRGALGHFYDHCEGWKFDKDGGCPCKDSEVPFAKDYAENGLSQRFRSVKEDMSFYDGKKANRGRGRRESGALMKDCWYWMELSLPGYESAYNALEGDEYEDVKKRAIDVKERKHRTTLVRIFAKVLGTGMRFDSREENQRDIVLLTGAHLDIATAVPEYSIRRAWLCYHVRPDWCKEFSQMSDLM